MNFGRGIVRAFDAATGLATVEVVGGHSGYLVMPALTGLSAANMTAGRRCLLVFFDERNPTDGCVVGTYDEVTDVVSPDVFGVQTANVVLAGPSAGGNTLPTWRALTLPDMPVTVVDHDHSGHAGDGGSLAAYLPKFYPLTTPATHTSWDGDSKTSGDSAQLDTSSLFGVPAGIKAAAVRIAQKSATADTYLEVRPSSGVGGVITVRTQVANVTADMSGVVACDANGDFYVAISANLANAYIWIAGYWL